MNPQKCAASERKSYLRVCFFTELCHTILWNLCWKSRIKPNNVFQIVSSSIIDVGQYCVIPL
ncbi:hypothetical protein I79_012730 [Cricetulus griseus]|uniref:Uncharacterized protein n=1 Tax=Cricetulus griseus TaxID=10029 RepID=G3HPL5_CRIGR|nr:hypothetical protein I79_012730 [Cricetulus griseus]